MVWGCVCGLDIIVKLFFVTSSSSWTQFFLPQCIDSGYLMSATPHTILYRSFWNFARFLHGLKMCMWFGYNPCINFCHFFHFANFCHFLTSDSMKVYRQWVPCECNSSYNFIPIFLKLCTCFCHGLEMCMWFGYNPWINFCHFFHFVYFVIFWPQILWKSIDCGYHVSATPYTTSCLSLFNFAHLFVHGLKMCMWFGFNPAFLSLFHCVNFVIFCRCDIIITEVRSIFHYGEKHQTHSYLIVIHMSKKPYRII